MSNLFGLNKPNTNLRKNVFDLSEKTLFSMSAGMLVPCFTRELNPGEKVQLDMSAFTRTQPLNTAAYVRCRQYIHAFFVPYKQLWSGWDNFFYGVDYRTSVAQAKSSNGSTRYSMVPRFNLWKIIAALLEQGLLIENYGLDNMMGRTNQSNKEYKDEHGYENFRGISRLLDMLGYGFVSSSVNTQNQHTLICSLSDLIEDYVSSLSALRSFTNESVYYSMTEEEKKNYKEALKRRSDALKQAQRELKVLVDRLKTYEYNVNPFRLLAYQKIYSDFYKRDDYEATYPEHFNIDDLSGDVTFAPTGSNEKRLLNMFRLRYRWLPKDYFTGVVPSELFGTSSTDLDKLAEAIGYVGDDAPFLYRDSVALGSTVSTYMSSEADTGRGDVNTKSIRAAFAIEKHLRLTRRAGGHDYISQTAAHFGFEPPKGRGDKVEFLGGYSGTISIGEVVTTANGHLQGDSPTDVENAGVGQIFGKGIGDVQGKKIEFTAKEHGVLMCICSVVPELDYSAVGLNRFNTKFSRGDYFQPEFQDLGLQPVYGYELKRSLAGTSDSSILGFAPRYAEYKTAYDTLHGEFRNGRSMSAWSADSLLDYETSSDRTGLRINSLRINPKCLDRIMSVEFNGSEQTDQFMVQAQFVCKVIRPMSITGQGL